MANMLRFTDSADRHLDATRRHIRLCNQVPDAHKFAVAIDPRYKALQVADEQYREAVYNRVDAYDDMIHYDRNLDNGIRTVYEKCNQFDRDNPGSNVLHLVFPNGTFSEYIRKNMFKEPTYVEQLAVKIESLGKNHTLFPLAAYIRRHILRMRKAIVVYNEALRNEKVVQAEEEVVKGNLRAQFEANYLDARKESGRTYADSLFPKMRHKPVTPPAEEPDEEVAEAA